MTDDELVEDLAKKVTTGEITFDKVRPLLAEKGFEESRIKLIVRNVDDEVQKALLTRSTASSFDQVIRLGIVLLVIGAGLSIASLVGFVPRSEYMVVIAYGSLIAGLVLIIVAIKRKRKKNDESASGALNRSFRLRDKRNDQ